MDISEQKEKILFDVSSKIRSSLELPVILQTAVNEIQRVLKVERAAIYYLDAQSQKPCITESLQADNLAIADQELATKYFSLIWDEILNSNKKVVVNDVSETKIQPEQLTLINTLGIKAYLRIPLMINQSLWGILSLSQFTESRSWLSEEITFLGSIPVWN